MSRGEPFASRADDDFTSYLLGSQRPAGAPASVVITEGPFAAPVSDPVAFRRHQMSTNETPTAGTYAKRARANEEGGAVVTPAGTGSRAAPAPSVKQASAELSPIDASLDLPGQRLARPEAMRGGTAPVTGSDVGSIPGANTDPMVLSQAPDTGVRGPKPSTARAVTAKILASIGKRTKGDVPSTPMVRPETQGALVDANILDLQPANDGRDRMSMTVSGINGSELNTGYSREPASNTKVGAVLKAVGVPPSLVGEESVLWAAVQEKVAAVAAQTDDAAAYIARDDTHPMALFTQLGARYGDEWLTWDLETIQQTLATDLGREPSTATMNKIAALQLLTAKPAAVYSDWHLFEKIAVAFDGAAPRLALIEDLSPEQMSFAASVMRMTAPDPRPVSGWTFAPDMQKYCAARLFDAGLVVAPPELGFCDAELQKLVGADAEPLRKLSMTMYLSALKGREPRDIDQEHPPAEFVQAARLMRIHAYVLDKIDDLVRQAL